MSVNPETTMKFHALCRRDELPARGRAFQIKQDGRILDIFIVPAETGVVAYRNSCPHTGVNLEWRPDQFLDDGGEFIQCSTHGAKFRIHDGYCVFGPCNGRSLKSVCLRENGAWLEAGVPFNETI